MRKINKIGKKIKKPMHAPMIIIFFNLTELASVKLKKWVLVSISQATALEMKETQNNVKRNNTTFINYLQTN